MRAPCSSGQPLTLRAFGLRHALSRDIPCDARRCFHLFAFNGRPHAGGGARRPTASCRPLCARYGSERWRGDFSFEVFNDDHQGLPLETVARRAAKSATWPSEDVLRRAVPLPNQVRSRLR